MANEKLLKPLSYVCPECSKGFNFAYQSSLNAFIPLHKMQHELAALTFKRQVKSLDELALTEFDSNFLRECGVRV